MQIDRNHHTVEEGNPYHNLKERFIIEVKRFLGMTTYLWVLFTLFGIHEYLVLQHYEIRYTFYGLAIANAVVLGKIMLIAEDLHLGERFKEKPLIYPIVYKSIVFAIVFMLCYVIEEVLVGVIKGRTLAESIPKVGGGSPIGILSVAVIIAVALIPFFAYREIGRVIGEGALHALIFTRRGHAAASAGQQPAG
jgi:hypothetical protein